MASNAGRFWWNDDVWQKEVIVSVCECHAGFHNFVFRLCHGRISRAPQCNESSLSRIGLYLLISGKILHKGYETSSRCSICC
jgi:hypothetical protein